MQREAFMRRRGTNLRKSAVRVGWTVLVFGSVLVACGDDDDGESCSTAACGGDVVGNWQVEGMCGWGDLEASFEESCPSGAVDVSGVTVTGPVTFESSGSYSTSLTLGGSYSFTYPPECLTNNGIQLTCEQLNAVVSQSIADDPESPIQSASCSGSGTCRCTAQFVPVSIAESGTYTTSGTTLTMTDSTGEVSTSNYCVAGNSLTVTDASADGENPSLRATK